MDLTNKILNEELHFIYKEQHYKQMEEAPMDSPISPIMANPFMEDFEIQAIESAFMKPTIWM